LLVELEAELFRTLTLQLMHEETRRSTHKWRFFMQSIEALFKTINPRKRYLGCLVPLMIGLATGSGFAQNLSTRSNALDRINFGDTGTDTYSESAHTFVNMGSPTGTGALGLTYREIAPSSNSSDVGIDADNEVLTFTMACNPTLQNYVTIQVWGSDTITDYIYLYTPIQGYVSGNYGGSNQPEIDSQDADPILPGRWVYETLPIPLSMTSGNTSVTLTLDAPLKAGQTSRPIYSAFTHTNPYLIVSSSDPQGTAPSASAPTPATYNSAYFSSIVSSISSYLTMVTDNQLFGSNWQAAVNAGTVPAQIYGAFGCCGTSPTDVNTPTQWLNYEATYAGGNNSGNNTVMQRLEMLAYAYVTPNFLTNFYQNSDTEQRIVAGLDAYSYMQALDGCWGDVKAWDGVGATTASTSNPYGRQNAQCNPIEGQGTWALGAAILQLQGDPSFRAALNQPISSTLEPGVLRYQAYQTMLVNNIGFLTGRIGHGHAPNQDLLQARSYLYSNLALRALDAIYGTSLARSNAQMYSDYLNETSGLALSQASDLNISNGGLGLEVNGSLNGGYDGGYGWLDAYYLTDLARILNDNGIENATSHPVRDVAINATHAFSNFLYPSLVASGSGYATTMRSEQFLTFRYEGNVGPIDTLSLYYPAVEFNDPYALHGFYLEHANGVSVPMLLSSPWNAMPGFNSGNADNTVAKAMLSYVDYVTLCNMVNSQPTDPSGVTFLNETAHPDGVWADPTGSTIAIKHAGEDLRMVLNWRPLATPGVNVPLSPTEPMNNVVRVHDTTATMDRLATVDMPASAATGASGNYTSGAAETLYVARYGNYLVGLNWQTSAATMTLPPDMQTSGGTATDLVSGTNYNLSTTTTVSVPAGGAVALYQYLPTSTLSSTAVNFGSHTVNAKTTSTVTLSNTGTGPLLIGSMGISGGQASDFSYTTSCSSSLPPNSSCTITLNFTPNASGAETATFSLTTSLSTSAQTISLSGTGVGYVTSTELGSSAKLSDYGMRVILTARVISREGHPSGVVTFYNGSTSLGTGTLNGFGVAVLATTELPVGRDSVTASYGASTEFGASISYPITETVFPDCTDHHPGDHHDDHLQWDERRHQRCWVASNP
jgi:Bacterial Ig-like domain (group 3)/Abnormal spindle-like microcephaly-assoc'd, ASPM-SPD-2-Hydin